MLRILGLCNVDLELEIRIESRVIIEAIPLKFCRDLIVTYQTTFDFTEREFIILTKFQYIYRACNSL